MHAGCMCFGNIWKLSLLQSALKHKEEGVLGEGWGVHHQTVTMHVKYRTKENAAPSEKKKALCESLQSLQICIAWMCGSAQLRSALLVSFSSLFQFYCMQVDCRGCSDGMKAVKTLSVCLCPADSSLFMIILRYLAAKGAFFSLLRRGLNRGFLVHPEAFRDVQTGCAIPPKSSVSFGGGGTS